MSDGQATPFVRPYVLTGGRTRPRRASLPIEALVSTCLEPATSSRAPSPEERDILSLCRPRAISVAEVGAHLRMPLGVARVLVGDLADEGLVEVTEPDDEPDVSLLKEVLHGLLVDQ